MAQICVQRSDKGWRDSWRSYRIFLDDREVGSLARGAQATLSVSAGRHRVQLRIDWCSSPAVDVDLTEQQTVRLVCRPNGSPWTALFDMVSRPEEYVRLERSG